jgi:transcriptional regulator with XRE-family HTH domain
MQDEDKKIQQENKTLLLKVLGKVIYEKRQKMGKGINKFSYEYDIGNGLLSRLEKGTIDTKLSTVWKLANAFGLSCSEFISIIETSLPKEFNFYK